MNIDALSTNAPLSMQNRFKANGGSEDNSVFDLNIYETPFRGYDAVLGRFHQVDAMADMLSSITPYNFGYNNPIMFNDPTGLMPGGCKATDPDCESPDYDHTVTVTARKRGKSGKGFDFDGLMADLKENKNSLNVIQRHMLNTGRKKGANGLRTLLSHERTISTALKPGHAAAIAHSKRYMSQMGTIYSRTVGGSILAVVGGPILIEGIAAISIRGGVNAAIDASTQIAGNMIANGGNLGKAIGDINITSLGMSAINPSGSFGNIVLNSTVSNSFRISLGGDVNTVLNGRSGTDVALGVGVTIGTYGLFRGLGAVGQAGMNNSMRMINEITAPFSRLSHVNLNREGYILGVSYMLKMSGTVSGTATTVTGNLSGN